jgi:hypothetical protein
MSGDASSTAYESYYVLGNIMIQAALVRDVEG